MANELDGIYDAGLNACKSGAIRVALCSAQPANFAGIAAVRLAEVTVDSSDYTGPADHTPSGRKITCAAQPNITPTANGTGTHLVHHNNVDTIYATPPCNPQAVTTAQLWTFPEHVIAATDPA